MPLTTQYVEMLSDKDPYLRYDQYRGRDSQEHKAKLAKEAAFVEQEASKKEIILDMITANLDPEPHWCEAVVVKVSRDRPQLINQCVIVDTLTHAIFFIDPRRLRARCRQNCGLPDSPQPLALEQ